MRSSTLRGAAAVATAVACLLLSATPAPATPTTMTLLGGTLELPFFGPLDLDDGPEPDPCGVWDPPPVLDADVTGSTVDVTGPAYFIDPPFMKWTFLNPLNVRWYQLDLFVLSEPPSTDNSGTLNGTGTTLTWDQDLYLLFEVYELGPDPLDVPEDCEKDELVCIFGSQLTLSGPFTVANQVGVLDGGGPIDVFFCDDAGLAGNLTGLTITVDDLIAAL
jgi:hypothetical protein